MKKERRTKENIQDRVSALLRYTMVSLAVISCLAVVYAATVPAESADGDYNRSPIRRDAVVHRATRQAVLQWMKENSSMPEQVLTTIYSTAENSADRDVILAICLVESNFNPRAESGKGAMGLMGIMPTIWLDELRERGIVREKEDLFAIQRNINSGIYVLTQYLEQTHNLKEALSRYAGRDPAYAKKVLRALGEIARVRRSGERLVFADAGGRRISAAPQGLRTDM